MTSLILNGGRGKAELLRRNAKGRVRTGRERREMLLAQFDRSGVSAALFARMAGINYQTFAGWLHVRRRKGAHPARRDRKEAAASIQWMEAVPAVERSVARPATEEVRVHLPGGAWLTISSGPAAAVAAELLRALAAQGGGAC